MGYVKFIVLVSLGLSGSSGVFGVVSRVFLRGFGGVSRALRLFPSLSMSLYFYLPVWLPGTDTGDYSAFVVRGDEDIFDQNKRTRRELNTWKEMQIGRI